ncbi:hypothetical protein FIBSPDRAFT_874748 [Athelia psychrophila]|uniref:Uncharacterized protein n=1 Tax=Athelia psychrophila TaxID=1759441 RepID=A0A165X748_9AGAM|nr:hypothetical protein FIBSPDRAFT_874748 [Fibularhizoctonia sp. CBS 109695]
MSGNAPTAGCWPFGSPPKPQPLGYTLPNFDKNPIQDLTHIATKPVNFDPKRK